MQIEEFKALVARLEAQSAQSPGTYRFKVALLTLLGFGLIVLLLAAVGLGLTLLVGFAVVVVLSGGTALLLLLKLGKLLVLLAWPLWLMLRSSVRALFVRLPRPEGHELTRAEAPALFAALDRMRLAMRGPQVHHVLIVDDVNAAIVQRPAFGLVGWPRNFLLLGLPLLEGMAPDEALAVVAHEYGHLAGSHGHFGAFIYRLRHTWGTVQAYAEHLRGWVGAVVAPPLRWYGPFFNAYTFVLARANEYQADAAAAELVGAAHAAHALKRVNVLTARHQRFMGGTFERIDFDAAPPPDLMQRWASHVGQMPAPADTERWLGDALDREGQVTDSHPTLRARLAALPLTESVDLPPPPLAGPTAAQAWLGAALEPLRQSFQRHWADQLKQPWAERHAQARELKQRLSDLRGMEVRDEAQELELLRLTRRFEPETDLREALVAFNAEHADRAGGLFLEALARLDREDAAGLDLLERAIALDPEGSKLCCEQAHAFLVRHGQAEAAERWAQRWRERDALETARSQEMSSLPERTQLAEHGLDEDGLRRFKNLLDLLARKPGGAMAKVQELYLARRPIVADPSAVQYVIGFKVGWWNHRRGLHKAVLQQLLEAEWPAAMYFCVLDRSYKPLLEQFRLLAGARLR